MIAVRVPVAKSGVEVEAPFQTAVGDLAANEFVFAVVGPVGSGTSQVAAQLGSLLGEEGFECVILKAREVIEKWMRSRSKGEGKDSTLAKRTELQDAGDDLRKESKDNAAVAVGLVARIREERATRQGSALKENTPVEPDGSRRAYILDSIRHPHEALLLRRVYQEAFCLVGVFCKDDERKDRLQEKKYTDAGAADIERFMQRDENAPEAHGQKVSDAFHLSDYFVDNSRPRFLKERDGNQRSNAEWGIPEQLGRLVDILTRKRIVRPRPSETGMFHAYGARMQSSCLSRQVGAALLDQTGAVVSTGTNEVPRAGGGVYGGVFQAEQTADPARSDDFRCFVHRKFCTNTRHQNEIIEELLGSIDKVEEIKGSEKRALLAGAIRKSRIGQILEFSRAVHAEMDALLSAARNGIKTVGTRLFVTTFPCHSCARHIVAAGVDEVQYIEPYLKSQAIPLHGDAIVTDDREWNPPSQQHGPDQEIPAVLFRPFIGVAPRLYRRAFFKDTELKDGETGAMLTSFQPSSGHAATETMRVSYAQIEARLASL